ncbi:MAG: serine/threonine protein kinase, partial [Chloroflexi bacterium]|nr:serine/threonine protein kinase [Chloroflexota bacterium]
MNDTAIHAQNLVGQNLGRYRIQELLGRGGMAWVYRAWDQQLERAVAIKVITPQSLEMEQSMERFQREARAIARLDHPHIVQLYDFGEVQGLPYMVMPYIAGPNLEEWLREVANAGQPLRRADILTILDQVAEALDCAHAQGLIHRDVKPSNILFKTPEHVVLSDFGVARLHAGVQGQHPTLTDADQVLGTPTYMAPEQATRTVPASPASDVYSLAVVAYEMIGGQPPFEADSTLSAILLHILEPPPSILQHRPDLPPAVDEVLQRALDKDPVKRFATATAFVTALAAAWGEAAADAVAEAAVAEAAVAVDAVAEQTVIKREAPASESTPAEPPPSPPDVARPAATVPPA